MTKVFDAVKAEDLPLVEEIRTKAAARNAEKPSPKGWIHHPDCAQGKRGYFSKKKLREDLSHNEQALGHRPRIYRCQSCHLWHHTSMTYQEQQSYLSRVEARRQATHTEGSGMTAAREVLQLDSIADLLKSEGESGIYTITPETATHLLDYNEGNRKVKPANRAKFVRAMTNGEWVVNGEAIKISNTGRLLDGQHRLLACEEAGVPFDTYVIFGLPDETQLTMDQGTSRTVSDLYSDDRIKNKPAVAAAARVIIIANRKDLKTACYPQGSADPVTHLEILRFTEEHVEALNYCVAQAQKIRSLGVTPRIGALAFRALAECDIDQAEEFFDRLSTGAGLDEDSPILTLRNTLSAIKLSKGRRLSTTEELAYLIKAWNKYRKGEPLKILSFRPGGAKPEKFPTPI